MHHGYDPVFVFEPVISKEAPCSITPECILVDIGYILNRHCQTSLIPFPRGKYHMGIHLLPSSLQLRLRNIKDPQGTRIEDLHMYRRKDCEPQTHMQIVQLLFGARH